MIPFTRRSFLQSSLAAALVAAAEATQAEWLLSTVGRMRVGVVGLGTSTAEHLALFAAIPGLRVAGLADGDSRRIAEALRQINKLGQAAPRLYRNLDEMLKNEALEVISVPNRADAQTGAIVSRALAGGLPVLADLPPAIEPRLYRRFHEELVAARVPVQFRLRDYTYPASATDLADWLKRTNARGADAYLTLSRTATKHEIRACTVAALDALLTGSSLSAEKLIRWLSSKEASTQIDRTHTMGVIVLPPNFAGIGSLRLHLLGNLSRDSTLVTQHAQGSMKLSISSQADAESSLQTVLGFMNSVRRPSASGNSVASRAQAAAVLADRFMSSLLPLHTRSKNRTWNARTAG